MAYVEVARFSSRMEAETVGHALDQHGIPFMVQSSDVGMFGPGMTGFSPGGAALCVPEESVESVRELLTCVVPGAEEGDATIEAVDPPELRGDDED